MVMIKKLEPKERIKTLIQFGRGNNISIEDAAEICGKRASSIEKWMVDGWPRAYEELVRLHAEKRILPESWQGVSVEGERLRIDEKHAFSVDEIKSVPRNMLVMQQRERRHKKEIDSLKQKFPKLKNCTL